MVDFGNEDFEVASNEAKNTILTDNLDKDDED